MMVEDSQGRQFQVCVKYNLWWTWILLAILLSLNMLNRALKLDLKIEADLVEEYYHEQVKESVGLWVIWAFSNHVPYPMELLLGV